MGLEHETLVLHSKYATLNQLNGGMPSAGAFTQAAATCCSLFLPPPCANPNTLEPRLTKASEKHTQYA
jgi:hypothetical protein